MTDFSTLARGRRSIRKYEDKDIPNHEIEELIQIAVTAPSGCNSQCWRFVAVKDRAVIKQIETAVVDKIDEILHAKKKDLSEDYLTSRKKAATFFTKAPVVLAVFMTKYEFYDQILTSALNEQGFNNDDITKLYTQPDLLSVGAAIQNLLLAAHERGYGACWTNEAGIAGVKINEILGEPPEHKFISLIPIGVPAYTPREKKMKEIKEIFSVI
jgi:nitroreductase